MRGECLCGDVQFEVTSELRGVYQCHCNLCRKQGGSASNTATIVPAEKFRWLSGEDNIGTWRKASGFRSHFCRNCGAPVPNALGDSSLVWVPVGLLEATLNMKVVAHLHTASMATWDPSDLRDIPSFEAQPDLEVLLSMLQNVGDG